MFQPVSNYQFTLDWLWILDVAFDAPPRGSTPKLTAYWHAPTLSVSRAHATYRVRKNAGAWWGLAPWISRSRKHITVCGAALLVASGVQDLRRWVLEDNSCSCCTTGCAAIESYAAGFVSGCSNDATLTAPSSVVSTKTVFSIHNEVV